MSGPFSQRQEFGGDRLAEQFGTRYQQRGHELGGHGHTTADGIDRLRLDAERATLILLCMAEAPGDCHRHHAICGRHFPHAVPIFRDEQFTAKALQDALDAGDVARLYGETADFVPVEPRRRTVAPVAFQVVPIASLPRASARGP